MQRRRRAKKICPATMLSSRLVLLLAAVGRSAIASHTGYGEGVLELVPDSLFCNFDRAYYGDYYFNGFKFADNSIQTCIEKCFNHVSVEHSPYEVSFEPVSPSPAPASSTDTGYTSLVVYGDVGEFFCNCPTGYGIADANSLSATWTMDTMGHVQRAWGQISWEDHVPYTMDTSSGLPIESSQTSFGSFQFTQDELVRHAASAHLAFTMPRTKFCRGGCNYWDRFQCEGDFILVEGDAFKLELNDGVAHALAPFVIISAWVCFFL
eukprot:INCI4404.1.p1 GENE.INCI4404.1~~INCI4404.1.p1  ORF type:complete len:265 (-),score=40.10 INCI4404.1:28-822(-)